MSIGKCRQGEVIEENVFLNFLEAEMWLQGIQEVQSFHDFSSDLTINCTQQEINEK